MNEGVTVEAVKSLGAEFEPSAIHWRAQTVTERNGKHSALALAYLDARNVMERLDEVCGPANWQDRYEETPKGRIICTLSICIDGYWVNKSDGAGDTDVEGDKGALSDALKRAAVKWGIGRYLYGLGTTWAECEVWIKDGKPVLNNKGKPTFTKWTPAGLAALSKALGSPSPKADPIPARRQTALPADVQDILDDVRDRDSQMTLKTLWDTKGLALSEGPHGAIVKDAFNKRKAAIELMDGVN